MPGRSGGEDLAAPKARRAAVITFGCQMNEYDSLRLCEVLAGAGFRIVGDDAQAEVLVINTCSVRAKAEQKVLSLLGRYKERAPGRVLVLAGCMAQTHGRALLERAPQVQLIVGPNEYHRLPELLARAPRERVVAVGPPEPAHDFPAVGHDASVPRTVNGMPGGVAAFVTIMKGCDNHCAYCVVPYARGPERSRPAGEVLAEVSRLVAQGVREVTLLGQNVNSYRAPDGLDFAGLLRRVGALPGLARLRFMTNHPKDLSERLVQAMVEAGACEHLHLPLQSGSDRVLAAMGRGYTSGQYLDTVAMVRRALPEVRLTTDVLVGFPGETDQDFQATRALVERVGYGDLFAFAYSPRPHTPAARLPDEVPYERKVERLTAILEAQAPATRAMMEAEVGRERELLIEGPSRQDATRVSGRTRRNVLVHLDQPLAAGSLVTARIVAAGTHSLRGEPAGAGRTARAGGASGG